MYAKNIDRFPLRPMPTCSRNRSIAVARDLKGRGKYEREIFPSHCTVRTGVIFYRRQSTMLYMMSVYE